MDIKIPFLGYIKLDFHIGYKNKIEKEVCEIYKNTINKIPAIRFFKNETGKDIKESKEKVDEILEKYNLD